METRQDQVFQDWVAFNREYGRVGRAGLLQLIYELLQHNKTLNTNLSNTQQRCNELLEENRRLRSTSEVT